MKKKPADLFRIPSRVRCLAVELLALVVTPGLAVAAPAEPTNFVVIMADDLGYGDLGGVWGGAAHTPQLEQMAFEGMRFTDFHSSGPVCTPTRAALMTGRYPARLGIVKAFNHPFNFEGWQDLGIAAPHNRSEVTIATRLDQAGYVTGIFGKWHLGKNIAANPTRHGFDEFRGLTCGCGDYFSKHTRYGEPDWWHDDQLEFQDGYATRVITDNAVRFIEQHDGEPFFLYVPYSAIHFPWQDLDDADEIKRETGVPVGRPGAATKVGPNRADEVPAVARRMIEEVDAGVGRILATLRTRGLDRFTLVIFKSDNGGYTNYRYGDTPIVVSSNGPLRGAKGDVYEGGHRVPCIAWWPGRITPGTVTAETAVTMDLVPTILELAGLDPPAPDGPNALDGVSLVPVLLERRQLASRTLFWMSAPRRGGQVSLAARWGPWKLVDDQLFNLGDDLGESRDVAKQFPELARELKARRAAWENDVRRPDVSS